MQMGAIERINSSLDESSVQDHLVQQIGHEKTGTDSIPKFHGDNFSALCYRKSYVEQWTSITFSGLLEGSHRGLHPGLEVSLCGYDPESSQLCIFSIILRSRGDSGSHPMWKMAFWLTTLRNCTQRPGKLPAVMDFAVQKEMWVMSPTATAHCSELLGSTLATCTLIALGLFISKSLDLRDDMVCLYAKKKTFSTLQDEETTKYSMVTARWPLLSVLHPETAHRKAKHRFPVGLFSQTVHQIWMVSKSRFRKHYWI